MPLSNSLLMIEGALLDRSSQDGGPVRKANPLFARSEIIAHMNVKVKDRAAWALLRSV